MRACASGRPDEREVQRSDQVEVVGVAGAAREEGRILDAHDARAHDAHRISERNSGPPAPRSLPAEIQPLPPRIDRPQRRHRAVARAERVGVPDRLHDVALAERHRLGHGHAPRQPGGGGRGHAVAAAVGVARGEPRPGQLGERVAVVEQVDAHVGVLGQVPALDQHVPRPHGVQQLGRLVLRGPVVHVDAHEQPHLVQVRRDDGGAGEQQRAEGVERLVGQQLVAVHRRGHRVDDERGGAVRADPDAVAGGGDRPDDRRGGEHAGLRRVQPDVGGDRLDLRRHRLRRQRCAPR